MNEIYQFPVLGFIQGIGTPELLIICFVLLLLFGAKKLPELARGMGKSIKEFKKATSEIEEDFKTAMDTTETPAKPVTPAQAQTPATQETTAESEPEEEKKIAPVTEESD